MAAKKTKKKARQKKPEAPPDIRAALPPTPANLTATLEAVRKSLELLEKPETPINRRPAAKPQKVAVADRGEDRPEGASAEGVADEVDAEARAAAEDGAETATADPVLEDALPEDPESEQLVEAMLHITLAEGIPCGIGQECRRRLVEEFVDRNEFRLTEAFEIERLLGDLEIPRLFDRSLRARDSIAEIYNDQNGVTLEFLRESSVTDRNMFFQRMPVLKPVVVHFLTALVTFEEILFSDRSTLRLQQRLGMDPKNKGVNEFFGELKQLVAPFGHLPLDVGPNSTDGRPLLEPQLSAACLVIRLAPPSKGK